MISLDGVNAGSKAVQSVCAAALAIIAVVSALNFGKWRAGWRGHRATRRWQKRFPASGLNRNFHLYYRSYTKEGGTVIGHENEIYLCDDKAKQRHWIKNEATLATLGFNHGQTEGVTKATLEAYANAEPIGLAA